MRKIISYTLIIAGVLIILLPKAREWYYDRQQEQLLEQMEAYSSAAESNNKLLDDGYKRLSQLFNEADVSEAAKLSQTAHLPEEDSYQKANAQAIAVIKIDKIDLKIPVLEGATLQNMKFAAAHMSETTPLDQIGNAAIAAHRAQTKGRLFNRLNEVVVGDEIIVQMKGQDIVYTVFNVSIVEPTDISVLSSNDTDRVLTLITCDPIESATHRLIVQAKR
ncbi:class D sortase [Paenibacillus eucommiae]|uniref:Sortase A n=1 Tax=Paenibacillus eucommiae TaxID=1355755 RepID=A0ABS4J851_9BACL|nr:class D sortase [Paenibacillus eucommiae]MBP1996020.1 sortase A [Paenibacillus eucommiae]